MKKRIVLISVLFVIMSLAVLNGETVLTTLDDIAALGAENNLEYKRSQINLKKADANKVGILKLENSSISAQGNYNDQVPGDEWALSSTLNIPVLDQITISGTISEDLSGQIGITLKPLAHDDASLQSKLNYTSALKSVESTRIDAENNAISAALNWMFDTRDLEVQQISAELAEINYHDDKIRYDIGEITLDDLEKSLIEWSQSRVLLSTKQQDLRESESILFTVIGINSDLISLDGFDVDYLENEVQYLKDTIDPQMGDPLNTESYQVSLLNIESAESLYKNTWAYEPELNAGAGLNFDSKGSANISAFVQFTLSLDDFQKNQRDIAWEEFQNSITQAEQNRNEVELEFIRTKESLTLMGINKEIAVIELEQSRILLSEAELLNKIGDYSDLDLEESQLTLLKAENALFRSLADEYLAWVALRKYL